MGREERMTEAAMVRGMAASVVESSSSEGIGVLDEGSGVFDMVV